MFDFSSDREFYKVMAPSVFRGASARARSVLAAVRAACPRFETDLVQTWTQWDATVGWNQIDGCAIEYG